jgi:hypothetical protein
MRNFILGVSLCAISASSFAQTIIFDLKQIRQKGSSCEIIFDIKNNTGNNITKMMPVFLFRGSDGYVIDKMEVFPRIRPNSVTAESGSLRDTDCRSVKSFQFKELGLGVISYDGEMQSDRVLESIVRGILVKSSIGAVSVQN